MSIRYRAHYSEGVTPGYYQLDVENGIIIWSNKDYQIGRNLATVKERLEVVPATIVNEDWEHLKTAIDSLYLIGYNLSYSRPMGCPPETPWQSCINPSFQHPLYALKSFQIIWNRKQPLEIWLNHGYPDVFEDAKKALVTAGFTLINKHPNK